MEAKFAADNDEENYEIKKKKILKIRKEECRWIQPRKKCNYY